MLHVVRERPDGTYDGAQTEVTDEDYEQLVPPTVAEVGIEQAFAFCLPASELPDAITAGTAYGGAIPAGDAAELERGSSMREPSAVGAG